MAWGGKGQGRDEMGLGCGCLRRVGQGRYQDWELGGLGRGERRSRYELGAGLALANCCAVTVTIKIPDYIIPFIHHKETDPD